MRIEEFNHLKGKVLWLMGPTSSGKTTIGNELVHRLRQSDLCVIFYDGDEIRDLMGPDLGFEAIDRLKVVKTIVYLANKAASANMFVVVAALTANQDAREYVTKHVSKLILGYIKCDIQICAHRDPKGLYQKAKEGKINTLPGYNSVYLPPDQYDIELNTEEKGLEVVLEELMQFLRTSRIEYQDI